jgi:hypothetical protein
MWVLKSVAHYVIATKVSDDSFVKFAKGADYKIKNAQEVISTADPMIGIKKGNVSGLSVQKKGRFLFVSHARVDELHVVDKKTGELVKKIAMAKASASAVDGDDKLWIVNSAGGAAHVDKFAVSDDGSLSAPAAGIGNLSNPLAVAVSPDNKTVLVADGGTSGQVKAFANASPAAPLWTLGVENAWAKGPEVGDDRFFFSPQDEFQQNCFAAGNPPERSFIAFQSDGSFWVGDTANFRIQHYAADRRFIGRAMVFPMLYNVQAVANDDPGRVLGRSLEFKIDYSKPLAPDNGSWTLVKNWGYKTDSGGFTRPTRMSNGRTYGMRRVLKYDDAKQMQADYHTLVELSPTGVRETGLRIVHDGVGGSAPWSMFLWWLCPDGSLRGNFTGRWPDGTQTTCQTWRKMALTGFDANNNPTYGRPETIVASPPLAENDPVSGQSPRPWEVTSSGILTVFEAGLANKYHFGGVDTKTGKWIFRTSLSTGRGHVGTFPTDGAFATGNGVTSNTGGAAIALGRNIIWSYYGEGWSGGECNIFNHFYDDGLMVGQCGGIWNFNYAINHVDSLEAEPGVAGNGCCDANYALVMGPNGAAYIYHGDESCHGGMHRWRIDGLDSIKEQRIPITFTAATYVRPKSAAVDLHEGLPHGQKDTRKDPAWPNPLTDFYPAPLAGDIKGWHREPAADQEGWTAVTGACVYQRDRSPDISARYALGAGKTASISRELLPAKSAALSSWKIDGALKASDTQGFSLNRGDYGDPNGGGVAIEVLDAVGKVIARLTPGEYGRSPVTVKGNGKTIHQGDAESVIILLTAKGLRQPPHYSIAAKNGKITFSFAGSAPVSTDPADPACNSKRPATLRLFFWSGANCAGFYTNINLIDTTFTRG